MDEKKLDKAIKITAVLLIIGVGLSAYFFYAYRIAPGAQDKPIIDREIEVLEGKIKKNRGDFNLRILIAKRLLEKERFGEATDHLKVALKIDKKSLAAHYLLGFAHNEQNEQKEAIGYFEKTLELGKTHQFAKINTYLRDANYYLAEINYEKKKYDKALKYYKAASEVGTADSDTFYKIGKVYLAKKNYKDAMAYYDKALMFVPNYTEVLADYDKALEKMPSYTEGYYNLGKVYKNLFKLYSRDAKTEKAKESYDKAKSLFNTVLKKNSNHKEAKKALDALLKENI